MYRKMTRKGVSLREVFDALALRVVVDDQNGTKMQRAIEVRCSPGLLPWQGNAASHSLTLLFAI